MFGLGFIRQVAHVTLFRIHAIFPPPASSGHMGGKDLTLEKQLKWDDAYLTTQKEILGFDADRCKRTWRLPMVKLQPTLRTLRAMTKSHHIPKKQSP